MTRNACLPLLVGLTLLWSATAARAQVQGGGTPGHVPVWTDGSTLGDSAITQDGNNNIGIGTVFPTATFSVVGAGPYNALGSARFDLYNTTWGDGFLQHVTDQGTWQIASMFTGATRMVIDTNGNVGIATSDPGNYKLLANGLAGGFNGVYGTGIGTGVLGDSPNSYGVFGHSVNGVGVVGTTNTGLAALFDGRVDIETLGTAGGSSLCRNADHVIAFCSSSLRYKTDVRPFVGGLDIVNRLRPIAFTWKEGGADDVGLAAEDVEQVEPLLTFRNDKGEIEGVKYNQLSAVFVNAFVEQQAQIKKQQEQIAEQQAQLASLKTLVCRSTPDIDLCR